jgi:hypothetical protein
MTIELTDDEGDGCFFDGCCTIIGVDVDNFNEMIATDWCWRVSNL